MVYPDPNRPDVHARAEAGLTPWVYEPALGPDGEPGEYICAHGIRKWRPVPVFSPEDYTPPEPYPLTVAEGDEAGGAEEDPAPLPFKGGAGGGACRDGAASASEGDRPHPNPSPEGEGLSEKGRVWRSIDFTPPRRAMFLHNLAEQGNVRVACSRVAISPQAAYLARRRDAVFRAGWDAALVHSREHALQVLANHALEGIREEVWHRGEKVGEKVRHDARLLLAHLGRLDARCKDARAQARAERFDELLALVAGEDYAWTLRDGAGGARGGDRDEILPITREHHSNRAAGLADGGGAHEEPETLDHDELLAREAAEAEWDEWGERVDAVNDALEAGEEPVVQPEPEPEPPYEVKSLGGIVPRRGTRAGAGLGHVRAPSVRPCGPAMSPGGGASEGAEFFARTLSRPSTWSAVAPDIGALVVSLRSSPARGGVAPQA